MLFEERGFLLMKRWLLPLSLVLLLIGGCNQDLEDADPKDLPDTIAMQDDFTREFMASAEEEEEGYYLFESKTDGYTMLYPVNSNLGQIYFEKVNDSFETLYFGENKEISGVPYFIQTIYNQNNDINDIDLYFILLSEEL